MWGGTFHRFGSISVRPSGLFVLLVVFVVPSTSASPRAVDVVQS